MTKEEAIERIKAEKVLICGGCVHPQEIGYCENICKLPEAIDVAIEALQMAIEALSKGATINDTQYEWIVEHGGNGWNDWENLICPKCGEKHEQVPYYYNFCPKCGVKVKVGNKHERIY